MERKLNIINTNFEKVFILETNYFQDGRGSFGRLFCEKELFKILENKTISQINHSKTRVKGTLRGLHYQNFPYSEIKIIKCLKGKIFDVIVDIRENSKTFLNYFTYELSSNENKMLFIPEGFAHGFQTLENNTEILYFHTNIFTPENENSLNVFDPKLNIPWPEKITTISEKDKNVEFLNNNFKGIKV